MMRTLALTALMITLISIDGRGHDDHSGLSPEAIGHPSIASAYAEKNFPRFDCGRGLG